MPVDSEIPWWKKTVVYQIYPRSFMDGNGDGIGDLRGIISKLDYIKEVGFETIWFSPFYRSPQKDFGYDISDYLSIAPEYGDMELAQELIDEIHAREMKVVFDMVLNHTSDEHPWFVESKSSRDNPKADWYVWRDGKKPTKKRPGGKKPPNNWLAMIGGSGWHYEESRHQYYWTQFLPCQPDLNYRNPEVKEAMLGVVKFWLDRGVDGFRLDIINTIYEDAEFRDNPFSWHLVPSDDSQAAMFQEPKYTRDQPETLEFMRELRAVVDGYSDPPRFMVGEVSAPLGTLRKYVGEQDANGLHLVFLFQTLGVKMKAPAFRELVREFEVYFPEPFLPVWVFSNHDRMRRISRLGDDVEKAKLNAAFQLTVRGVPFVYYGEEIGMAQHYLPVKEALDPVALKFKWIPQFVLKLARKWMGESLNRDECRTPMQWDASPNAGFCPGNAVPWLPVTPTYERVNVAVESGDEDSLLACYRRLLQLRKSSAALNSGSIELLEKPAFPKSVLAFERARGEERVRVVLNFGKKRTRVRGMEPGWELLFSTAMASDPFGDGKFVLGPWEGVVLGRKAPQA
ncbi:MAG: alpha-glucosidase [Promethearchaeota archaeon]